MPVLLHEDSFFTYQVEIIIHFCSETVMIEKLPKDLRSVATYLDTWKCRSKTALGCLKDLGQELFKKEIHSDSNVEVIGNINSAHVWTKIIYFYIYLYYLFEFYSTYK